jgi:hypothetical protein
MLDEGEFSAFSKLAPKREPAITALRNMIRDARWDETSKASHAGVLTC